MRASARKGRAAARRAPHPSQRHDDLSEHAAAFQAFEALGGDAYGDVMFAGGTAQEVFARLPYRGEHGFGRAVITVDADDNLKPVCDQLKAEGHNFFAIGLFLMYLLLSMIATVVQEAIANLLNLRSANLYKGLTALLEDDAFPGLVEDHCA